MITYLEGYDLQVPKSRCHGQDFSTLCRLIEIRLGNARMGNARGITAHNVEVGARHHTGLGVPLYLRQPKEDQIYIHIFP